jgi:hypothetical protein
MKDSEFEQELDARQEREELEEKLIIALQNVIEEVISSLPEIPTNIDELSDDLRDYLIDALKE